METDKILLILVPLLVRGIEQIDARSAASAATLRNVSVFGVQFRQRRHLQHDSKIISTHELRVETTVTFLGDSVHSGEQNKVSTGFG